MSGVQTSGARRPTIDQAIKREFAGRETPAYEIKGPTGGGQSKGTVLLMHPGGWAYVGEEYLSLMDPQVQRWRDRGYTTVNVTYGAASQSEKDAVDFFDAIHKSRAGVKPTIAAGASAGGHLALMVGARRPALDLAVSEGGVVDLVNLPEGGFKDWVKQAWGPDLAAHSPLAQAHAVEGRVLLGVSQGDSMLIQGARDFKAERPQRTRLMELAVGDGKAPFIHANVDSNELPRFIQSEGEMARMASRDHYRG